MEESRLKRYPLCERTGLRWTSSEHRRLCFRVTLSSDDSRKCDKVSKSCEAISTNRDPWGNTNLVYLWHSKRGLTGRWKHRWIWCPITISCAGEKARWWVVHRNWRRSTMCRFEAYARGSQRGCKRAIRWRGLLCRSSVVNLYLQSWLLLQQKAALLLLVTFRWRGWVSCATAMRYK